MVIKRLVVMLAALLLCAISYANDYVLRQGDIVKISVFQSPELSIQARVSENGSINFPLIGSVPVIGLTMSAAERKIAQLLNDGSFVRNPHVNILLSQSVGGLVSVLGHVNKPGRYAVGEGGWTLPDMIATAGGIAADGADVIIATGTRDGKPFKREVDILDAVNGSGVGDLTLAGGDTVYVDRAPAFYIYGEVQKPGVYRLDRNMTVVQALAAGGGLTQKGTTHGIAILGHKVAPTLDDLVRSGDVIYVKEGVF